MAWGQYNFGADTVDETADVTDMSGAATVANQAAGRSLFGGSPARSMVALWFFVLAVYWALGYFFKGQRS
jgi:hypothetical protein